MHHFLSPDKPFGRTFFEHWLGALSSSVPLFLRLIPKYLAVTVIAACLSVMVLLVFGKAAFHLACMFSPLIFITIGMALRSADPDSPRAGAVSTWWPVASRFWRYSTPLALTIGLTLNVLILVSLFLADLSAVHAGKLPNLSFPVDLFSEAKLPLLPMLLTTAVEQQLLFMPLFVVMGGRFEPHIVGMVLGGRATIEQARHLQQEISKRQKLFLAPMRLLVLVGVGFQYWGKHLDATQNLMGTGMLFVSYFGWLFYACMLSTLSRECLLEDKKNPA